MSAAIGMLLLLSPLFPLAFGTLPKSASKQTNAEGVTALAVLAAIWLSGLGAGMLWWQP